MSRGKGKKTHQAEKILVILINAKEGEFVSLDEIKQTLSNEIQLYRLPTYLYDLKKNGAEIEKKKNGRNLVAFKLLNRDAMLAYAQDRKLIAPPPVELRAEDMMVTK